MTNRYDSNCNTCRTHTPAGTGTLRKITRYRRSFWTVTCPSCADGSDPEATAQRLSRGDSVSYGVATSSGWVGYRNRNGRCEDAPCCGCCTF